MKQENNNPRALITGHTRGIGRAIFDLLTKEGYECVGLSQSTGDDVVEKEDVIVDMIKDFDYVVLNAYARHSQLEMLKKIVARYSNSDKRVAVITSTSGTPECADEDEAGGEDYREYKEFKRELIGYIGQIQQTLVDKPLHIFDVCPDTVYTDMTVGLWEEYPKLQPEDVAECVSLCFRTKNYNINKIVIQKNAD
jgi:NAD(P)-dependent dehydrogenase (short-subunit alcohol dehydrogenase family)